MTPPRVAFFLPSLDGGGAERVTLSLVRGLLELGHPVDLVLVNAKGELLHDVPVGARMINLGKRSIRAALLGLVRYLRRERPPVLVSGINRANVVALAARLLTLCRTKVIVTEHTSIDSARHVNQGVFGCALPVLMGALYRTANKVVAVSTGAAEALSRVARLSPDRIDVIYNPVVDEATMAPRPRPDHRFFQDDQYPVVVAVGRLHPAKDFATLLQAFFLLRRRLPCRLIILGEGPLRAELETLAVSLGLSHEDVSMPGFTPDALNYMGHAQLFVLSSVSEGLPTVLIEAMACGCQVVATDCPSGPSEILQGGTWGELVPVRDPDRLANAMYVSLQMSRPPDVRQRSMAFGVKRSVSAYARLINELT